MKVTSYKRYMQNALLDIGSSGEGRRPATCGDDVMFHTLQRTQLKRRPRRTIRNYAFYVQSRLEVLAEDNNVVRKGEGRYEGGEHAGAVLRDRSNSQGSRGPPVDMEKYHPEMPLRRDGLLLDLIIRNQLARK